MNLIDLFKRNDRAFHPPEGVSMGRWNWGGADWRTLNLPSQAGTRLRLTDFADTHPLWSRPDTIGWFAACRTGRATLEIAIEVRGAVRSRMQLTIDQSPTPVPIPWPAAHTVLRPDAALTLTVVRNEGAAAVEILVHRMLSRSVLYDMAKGRGVEIGPGPKPQIHPGPDVDVHYIEEMPQEKWIALYDSKGQYGAADADWSRIQLGKASALPSDDESLDFIFSSHVFEHLANPLGHLVHWHSKLKPGGKVLAVIPELTSTKDRYMRPCRMKEFLREYDAEIWEPELRHYERNVLRLHKRKPDPEKAKAMMEGGVSIHVHFYDRWNIAELLRLAAHRLGYRGFRLFWSQNHKDFYFVLSK